MNKEDAIITSTSNAYLYIENTIGNWFGDEVRFSIMPLVTKQTGLKFFFVFFFLRERFIKSDLNRIENLWRNIF